jgi:hypothetical protein
MKNEYLSSPTEFIQNRLKIENTNQLFVAGLILTLNMLLLHTVYWMYYLQKEMCPESVLLRYI